MTNYNERLDEMLAKHGAEPGEMTHSLKQAIKQLIADEMLGLIGEDQPEFIDDYPFEYGKQYGRNELRNELRTKLAKWLNQPTVNQSASVSRSDEGGESTKGDEK